MSARRPASGEAAIRLATGDDAGMLHAMIRELAAATGRGGKITSRPDDFRRHAPLFDALVAEREGRPLGFCLFFMSFSSWRGEPGVYVQDLYVAGEARGSRLGRALVAAAARLARARGARYLRLSVARDNQAAREFYERIGLAHCEDECVYQAAGPAFERLTEGEGGQG